VAGSIERVPPHRSVSPKHPLPNRTITTANSVAARFGLQRSILCSTGGEMGEKVRIPRWLTVQLFGIGISCCIHDMELFTGGVFCADEESFRFYFLWALLSRFVLSLYG
jgi:hypothetical protein